MNKEILMITGDGNVPKTADSDRPITEPHGVFIK